ncbi:MAG TPA: hypothetical protein VF434_15160 [Promineifilum sp.]
MAESEPIGSNNPDLFKTEAHMSPRYRRLGLLNGLLIGLAIGLGAWGLELIRISGLPVRLYLPELFVGMGLMVILCGLTGRLTGRIARTPVTVLLWAITAVLVLLIMGYLPFYGRSFITWLADQRFWGRPVFPNTLGGTTSGLILGGLLIIIVLTVLALLQGYRLENIMFETQRIGRLNRRAWLGLLMPLPFVFLATLVTRNAVLNPASTAIEMTNRAILRAQGFEGDLRDLEDDSGISYLALRGVHDRIDGPFTLDLAGVNAGSSTVVVAAHFDQGAWIFCRVINDQLNQCFDATRYYSAGIGSLITGDPLPDDCRGCRMEVSEPTAAWLDAHRDRLGDAPAVEIVARQGNHALLGLHGAGDFAAECMVAGISPSTLTDCRAIGE